MRSVDEKRMSLILQNIEERPSKISIAIKNKLLKSKRKILFTEEGERVANSKK